MAGQPFERLLEGDPPLLGEVEALVVAAHRAWYEGSGRTGWTKPKAYHWLHYEDPDPVARLADGVRRLRPEGTVLDPAVSGAIQLAGRRFGYPSPG